MIASEPTSTDMPTDENPLSASQKLVLRMLAAGLTNKQVARRLDVKDSAVAMRVNRAMKTLGTHTPTQTVLVAWVRGFLRDVQPLTRR